MSRIVVALGGNALQRDSKDISSEAQIKTCRETAKAIADLIQEGHEVVIVHGNGPQVGQIVATYEAAFSQDKKIPVMPFPECDAMSEGYIGYHLQQSLGDELKGRKINKQVAAIVTQVQVDENDPAFKNPTKPVGSFFTEEQAKVLEAEKGYVMKEDAGRGYRRVVASPMPVSIIEEDIIKTIVNSGHIVIAAGGGGVPVVYKDGMFKGVPAVIDKDLVSEKLAEVLEADKLIILTAVEKVYINFNKPDEKALDRLNIDEAEEYMAEGHFAAGSMLPKIKAALMFAKSKKGRMTIITSLEKAKEAVEGKTGTVVEM